MTDADLALILRQCPAARAAVADAVLLERIANELAPRLRELYGGDYLRKTDEHQARQARRQRDAAIWRGHLQGKTHQQLMREHGISKRLVYAVIARMRAQPRVQPIP